MWTTDKTRRAHASPRPLRVAYLIPQEPDHHLLDALFNEGMSRWGGRRTPVISTDGTTVAPDDWRFLDLWDADILYSYVPITDALRDRIAYCLAPGAIEVHRSVEAAQDRYAYRPHLGAIGKALEAVSVLPKMARLQEVRGERTYEVLDREPSSDVPNDIADSFGFLSDTSLVGNLNPYAGRLSYKTGATSQLGRSRQADMVSYIEDVGTLEDRLAKDGRLLFPSQMSDMFCPYLNVLGEYRSGWDDRLTLVIGDEPADRLIYWNAIHRYKSLNVFRGNQLFRFSPERFSAGMPEWIGHLCGGIRNHRRLDGNAAANVQVISSSLDLDAIEQISKRISGGFGTMSSFRKLSAHDVLEPLAAKDPREPYRRSLTQWPAWNWLDTKTTLSVRIERNEIDLPCVRPWQVDEVPLGPTTVGSWICDLDIERTEDHSRYSNVVHHWMFPRRLALHRRVKLSNYGAGSISLLPPSRPTERGHFALWDDARWKRPTVRLPQDIDAFHDALKLQHPNTAAERAHLDRKGSFIRFKTVKLSDKGRDLLGVLKFFGNLAEATSFLTNPFLLSVIARLAPTDTSRDSKRIEALSAELTKRLEGESSTSADFERAAKRALELAARWFHKDSKDNDFVDFSWLRKQAREMAKKRFDGTALDECVRSLRNREFLFQGYGWRCHRCQHPNWVQLGSIANSMECVICYAAEDAPIGGDSNSHFKLNPFVSAAFGPASAQDSVVWCLAALMEKAQHSLLLTPTFDIRDPANVPNGTDLDVLASVDGKIHYYEVKRSFAGINRGQIDDLVNVSRLIRPDYAGFAIQNGQHKETLSVDDIAGIRGALASIDVQFVLMTGDQVHDHAREGIPTPLNEQMRWTVWGENS